MLEFFAAQMLSPMMNPKSGSTLEALLLRNILQSEADKFDLEYEEDIPPSGHRDPAKSVAKYLQIGELFQALAKEYNKPPTPWVAVTSPPTPAAISVGSVPPPAFEDEPPRRMTIFHS